jgi:PAB-dependent poly(A)-specific ribonuclease subunit 2
MKRTRHICAATQTGTVNILDSSTFKVLKTWNAHSAFMSDMDATNDHIVTCGFSRRGGVGGVGAVMLDPFVNVYDLKNLVALPPIPFPAGAAYVRMHPRMSTTSIVVSQLGQMHVVDLVNVNTSIVRQANLVLNSTLNKLEIAPSGQAIAIADTECYIHLWASPTNITFAEVSNPIEYPNPLEDETQLDWSEDS